jgi:hypothetical protein
MSNHRVCFRFMHRVVVVAGLLAAGGAYAQAAPKGGDDVPPPPKLSNTPLPADIDDAPSITIRQEGENKVEEFRTKGGRVYAVRVTPRFGKPYLLVSPDDKAPVPNTTELSGGVRATQWTLFEF